MSMHDEPERRTPTDDEERPDWRVIAGIVLFALAVIFILQNTQETRISFLFLDWDVGVWFGLLVTFLLGALAGWLVPRWRGRRRD